MNVCWLTDLHLDAITEEQRSDFFDQLKRTDSHAFFITGDTSDAPYLTTFLQQIVDRVERPVYFILGNHEYYQAGIKEVETQLNELLSTNPQLFWLNQSGLQDLNNKIALVGVDSWMDARYMIYQESADTVIGQLKIQEIQELVPKGQHVVIDKLRQLADQDTTILQQQLAQALSNNHDKVIVLTHYPPFVEACWHNGPYYNPVWLPFTTCKAVGDLLFATAMDYPNTQFLVLCGHTHHKKQIHLLPNLEIRVGDARVGKPEIQCCQPAITLFQ